MHGSCGQDPRPAVDVVVPSHDTARSNDPGHQGVTGSAKQRADRVIPSDWLVAIPELSAHIELAITPGEQLAGGDGCGTSSMSLRSKAIVVPATTMIGIPARPSLPARPEHKSPRNPGPSRSNSWLAGRESLSLMGYGLEARSRSSATAINSLDTLRI